MPNADILIEDILTHKPLPQGAVLALGNFDGVHKGHQAVIAEAIKQARAASKQAYCLSFEPHPHALFRKDGAPFLLTTQALKERFILQEGVEGLVSLSFTPAFAALTAEEFMEKVLLQAMRAAHVVVGFDFLFGSCRSGDRSALRRKLVPQGIGVSEVAPVCDDQGDIISSTRIRALVKQGKVDAAASLLGRPFTVCGAVEHGDQRGRSLGYPTANFRMGSFIRPLYGVYVAKARIEGSDIWQNAIANIGIRPSIGSEQEWLEVHLLDFNEDIYGKACDIQLLHFLRAERVFPSLDALKAQLSQDEASARAFHNSAKGEQP